jgi:hypothetical protein
VLPALLVALLGVSLAAAPAQAGAYPPGLTVTVDRMEISTQLGGKLTFRSTVRNDGPEAVSRLIAHLNVLSLRSGTYVDPEDWSSQRTRYLDPIPAGGATTITWHVHAVNGGVLGLYVALLSEPGVGLMPTTGPMIRLVVAEKKTLNAGGILPLALGIPAAIGLLTVGVRRHRARQPIR